jgi:hypothetical protein
MNYKKNKNSETTISELMGKEIIEQRQKMECNTVDILAS